MYGNVRKVERWQSCSLWTKCFISFLACSSLWVGVDSACWKQERNPTEAQSDVHIRYSHGLTAASQARAARPHTHNKCSFPHFSLFNFVSPFLFPLFPLSFLSLCFTPRENKMFSENEIRNMMFQVLSGLVFVHKHGKKLSSYIFLSFFCCFDLGPFAWATA